MICSTCLHWFSRCEGSPAGKAWADAHGYTGPLAPQWAPPGERCPGYTKDKRANSRTTTPVIR